MTPWGIRKKVKAALGIQTGGAAKEDTVSLTMILPNGSQHAISCEQGYTLVMASQSLETPIATNCPDGHCGHCAVDVVDATGLRAPSSAEATILKEKGHGADVRLACHAKVNASGAKIRVRNVWTMDSVKGG